VSFTVLKNGNLLTFSILDFINEWNVTGGLVNSVSYSNLIVSFSDLENGNILAGRADGPIEILNSSLTTLQTLYGHSEYVKVILTLSYDSFASGSKDDSIKIWKNNMSNESWTCVYTLKGHNGDILDLVLSTKANTLISASSDSTIKIWNFKTGQLIESLLSHQAPVNSLVGLKNNQFAAGSDDTEITIWNLNNTTKVKTLNATSQVNVLAVSKNWLISGTNKDNSLTIWNADTFEKIRIIRLNSEKITSLAVWNDNFLVVGSFGKGAIIISI
jgi:WD40 repeat protein